MLKTAEYVSLGHPDKIADYISEYILDCLIKQDNSVRYAVEVMVKDNTVVLGGEVCGNVDLTDVNGMVKNAIREIGYDEKYNLIWGDNAININKVEVVNLIGCQSAEIYQQRNFYHEAQYDFHTRRPHTLHFQNIRSRRHFPCSLSGEQATEYAPNGNHTFCRSLHSSNPLDYQNPCVSVHETIPRFCNAPSWT